MKPEIRNKVHTRFTCNTCKVSTSGGADQHSAQHPCVLTGSIFAGDSNLSYALSPGHKLIECLIRCFLGPNYFKEFHHRNGIEKVKASKLILPLRVSGYFPNWN